MTRFSRDWAVPYVMARLQLEPILQEFGFSLASEALQPESFGSSQADYTRRGERLRLMWDGKDRWLWIAVSTGGERPSYHQWTDLESLRGPAPAATMLTDGELGQARVDTLSRVLRHYLERL